MTLFLITEVLCNMYAFQLSPMAVKFIIVTSFTTVT